MMRGFGGLFGSPMAGMMAQQMGPRAPDAMQQPEQRWMDGGKFKGRDALGLALGAIGDAFTGRSNTANMILGNQQQRRDMATQQQLMAQQRAAGLEDYRSRKLVDQEFAQPEGPDIGLFEDNAGNRFRYDKRTGMPLEDKPVFVDPNERMFVQDGALVRVPNTFRQQQGGMPRVSNQQDYDALPAGSQYTDPNGNIRTKGGAASNGGGNFRP